jgi:hypothetical protein
MTCLQYFLLLNFHPSEGVQFAVFRNFRAKKKEHNALVPTAQAACQMLCHIFDSNTSVGISLRTNIEIFLREGLFCVPLSILGPNM